MALRAVSPSASDIIGIVPIANGGTGSATAAAALTALGAFPTVGTTTNNNAAAGSVGEYISSTVLVGSAVSLTSNTLTDVTSIALTAGDWDVWAELALSAGAGTTTSLVLGWISTTSVTQPTYPNGGGSINSNSPIPAGLGGLFPGMRMRISLAAPATAYLSTYDTFAVSTLSAYGFIGARRVR